MSASVSSITEQPSEDQAPKPSDGKHRKKQVRGRSRRGEKQVRGEAGEGRSM